MPQYSSALKGPQFKGGQKAFNIYLARNIRYPYNARKNNIHGKVIVQFIVERDGSLTEVKVLQSPNDDLSAEAIRVVKNSPKWAPVRQNGLTVRDKYTIPVKFALNGSK
jgi:protein TonB